MYEKENACQRQLQLTTGLLKDSVLILREELKLITMSEENGILDNALGSVESSFVAAIERSLQTYTLSNAVFLAERLIAEFGPSPRRIHLLVECYLRSQQAPKGLAVLRNAKDPSLLYLHSICAFILDELREAEEALVKLRNFLLDPEREKSDLENDPRFFPQPEMYAIWGKICRKLGRLEEAADHFRKSLSLNPLLWTSFEALCEIDDILPESAFGISGNLRPARSEVESTRDESSFEDDALFGNLQCESLDFSTPTPTRSLERVRQDFLSSAGLEKHEIGNLRLRSTKPSRPMPFISPAASLSMDTPMVSEGKEGKAPFSDSLQKLDSLQPGGRHRGVLRESGRRVMRAPDRGKEFPRIVSPDRRQTEGNMFVAQLLTNIGRGFRLLCRYECTEALKAFRLLSQNHFNTPWVLAQVARARFEMGEYAESERVFARLRLLQPDVVRGMEQYSTILWHLDRESELACLAHAMIENDRFVPETWIAVGNCFSLQHEHEYAIKFFNRALQIDPSFVYAHTLVGHEYCANQHWREALQSFWKAVSIDSRHYNAWYGIGFIYFETQQFSLAAYHFQRALQINPHNSVLWCYCGMAVHKDGNDADALMYLKRAVELNERNVRARFELARVLRSTNGLQAAVRELELLTSYAPREAVVYELLGRLYQKLNNRDAAMIALNTALALDPKPNPEIKEALASLKEPDPES